jgi:transcription-repair coupling factor (superfamily II helicase)
MKAYLQYFKNLIPNKEIIQNSKDLVINQTNDHYNMTLIACDFIENNHSIFVVLPNLYMAQQYYDGLSNLLSNDDVLFFPSDDVLTSLLALTSIEFKIERIYTIGTLLKGIK